MEATIEAINFTAAGGRRKTMQRIAALRKEGFELLAVMRRSASFSTCDASSSANARCCGFPSEYLQSPSGKDAFAQRIQRGVPIFHQDHDGGVENLFPNLYSLQSRHAVPETAVKMMAST